VFRWLIAVFVLLLLANAIGPALARLGLGKLPGDLRFTIFGRLVFLPFATTVLLSLVAGVVARFL